MVSLKKTETNKVGVMLWWPSKQMVYRYEITFI